MICESTAICSVGKCHDYIIGGGGAVIKPPWDKRLKVAMETFFFILNANSVEETFRNSQVDWIFPRRNIYYSDNSQVDLNVFEFDLIHSLHFASN